MAKIIICTLPNASELISGIPFVRQEDGSVIATVEVDAHAEAFVGIPGYTITDAPQASEGDDGDGDAEKTGKGRGRPPKVPTE